MKPFVIALLSVGAATSAHAATVTAAMALATPAGPGALGRDRGDQRRDDRREHHH